LQVHPAQKPDSICHSHIPGDQQRDSCYSGIRKSEAGYGNRFWRFEENRPSDHH